jgi:hypothetical protein
MQTMKSSNSEFDLYDSIVNGSLRPFLPEYSSETHIKGLIEDLEKTKIDLSCESTEAICDELKGIDFKKLGFKDGDEFQIEIIEQKKGYVFEITPIMVKEFNDLIDIDIPPPPDLKSEYFLELIEKEYEIIRNRAKVLIEKAANKDEISFYANKNIQIAKRIAAEAHRLSKQIKPYDSDPLGNSDYYIIYILKLILKRAIIYFQNLFEPYLDCILLTEEEIWTQLYEKTPTQKTWEQLVKKYAERKIEGKENSHLVKSKGYNNGKNNRAQLKTSFSDGQNVFSLEGDYWKIKYNGKETLLRDLKRIHYIAYLLDKPNTDFYCRELYRTVNKQMPEVNEIYSNMSEKRLNEEERMSLINIEIEGLNKEEKDKIEDTIIELWAKMNDSSISNNKKKELEKQWDDARIHLLNVYGIFIKLSKKGPKFIYKARLKKDAEKIRINVTIQIRKAIEDIERQIPKLGKHLRRYIQTGANCCYRPDPELAINWTIRLN